MEQVVSGCANFGLKRATNDAEFEFGEAAANFVRNNFYIDDGLVSVPSVKEAIDLLQSSRNLCANAGLKLHKFVSNKLEVLECLPEIKILKNLLALLYLKLIIYQNKTIQNLLQNCG